MKSYKHIIYIALLFSLAACQEVVKVDLKQAESRLVVEGYITDQPQQNYIKLSQSISYYGDEKAPLVKDAQINLLDENDQLITPFSFQDSVYKPDNSSFAAKMGKPYKVQIKYKGDEYEATGSAEKNVQLDSITYVYKQKTLFEDEGYYVKVSGIVPKQNKHYFRWMVYKNDSLFNDPGDYFIFDTQYLQENVQGFQLPFTFKKGDTVRLESYSLNRDMYDFYNEFVNLLFNDGGVFSGPPVNPTSNVKNLNDPENIALGFVQFSSVEKTSVIIEDKKSAITKPLPK